MGDNSNAILKSIVERIERIQREKDVLASDIRDIKAEAKSNGFHLPALNEMLRKRRMDSNKRREMEANLETYEVALGDLRDTPLGASAMKGAGLAS